MKNHSKIYIGLMALALAAMFAINPAQATNKPQCGTKHTPPCPTNNTATANANAAASAWQLSSNRTNVDNTNNNEIKNVVSSSLANQVEVRGATSIVDVNQGDSTSTVGDTTALGGAAYGGYSEGGKGGAGGQGGKSVLNSDIDNASEVKDSANNENTVNVVNKFPITLTPPHLVDGQQGPQLWTELHGQTISVTGKSFFGKSKTYSVLFLSEQFIYHKAGELEKCGVITSKSRHGKKKFSMFYPAERQYDEAIEVTQKLVMKAPKGTGRMIALVSTGYHNRSGSIAPGIGEMTNSGKTQQITAALGGGAIFPFPLVRAYYCSNGLKKVQ